MVNMFALIIGIIELVGGTYFMLEPDYKYAAIYFILASGMIGISTI